MSIVDFLTDSVYGGKRNTRDRELRGKIAEIRVNKNRIEREAERLVDDEKARCRQLQRASRRSDDESELYALARDIKLLRRQKTQFKRAARQLDLLQSRLRVTRNQHTIQRSIAEATDILKELASEDYSGASGAKSMREFSREMQRNELHGEIMDDTLEAALDDEDDLDDDESLHDILRENGVHVSGAGIGGVAHGGVDKRSAAGAAASSSGARRVSLTDTHGGGGAAMSSRENNRTSDRQSSGTHHRNVATSDDANYSMQLLERRLKNLNQKR